MSPAQLQDAIDHLGDLDYATRTGAARTIRRTPGGQAVPALLNAVTDHADGYVRYRALVLLTGFNDPRTKDAMREAVGSPNDRLRTVGYSFFESQPDPDMVPILLEAFESEQAEFVRPGLIRALAAARAGLGDRLSAEESARIEEALIRDVGRGEDFFRSAVIEALGDYRARYAFDALTAVAQLDGPLQDDAALALGKIGDKRAIETLSGLQRTAPREVQPTIAAAICLLDINCSTHESYLLETLRFAHENVGFQGLMRSAAAGLGTLAISGHPEVVEPLLDVGIRAADDTTRAPVALAVGAIALRNTPMMVSLLEEADTDPAVDLLAEGFDMLEEDLAKERFFARVRRTYWEAPEASPTRDLMQLLIGKLDF